MIIEREISWRTPVAAFAPLAGDAGAVLLHAGAHAADGRWSLIAAAPSLRILARQGVVTIDGAPAGGDLFSALDAVACRRAQTFAPACGAPFSTGLIGFAGYECGGDIEPSARGKRSPHRLPDAHFGAYDAVAVFDRERRRAFILARAEDAATRLSARLGAEAPAPSVGAIAFEASNFTRADYEVAIRAVIERIRDGEFFQANISQRLQFRTGADFDPYGLFCAAAARSSAPFGAYLALEEGALISLSPERFFRIFEQEGARRIRAEPIKGTRPRAADPKEDARLLAELRASPKDRAENIMIADLTRNDLSRLCLDASIREEAICAVARHATVHHLVSKISGELRAEVTPAAALRAMFPCGSITGAPKVQAMKAIAETEKVGRGPYCGAIGYIDDRGVADFSVAIRTAIFEAGVVTAPVGGGITLRSAPAAEYEETLAKAAWLARLDSVRNGPSA